MSGRRLRCGGDGGGDGGFRPVGQWSTVPVVAITSTAALAAVHQAASTRLATRASIVPRGVLELFPFSSRSVVRVRDNSTSDGADLFYAASLILGIDHSQIDARYVAHRKYQTKIEIDEEYGSGTVSTRTLLSIGNSSFEIYPLPRTSDSCWSTDNEYSSFMLGDSCLCFRLL